MIIPFHPLSHCKLLISPFCRAGAGHSRGPPPLGHWRCAAERRSGGGGSAAAVRRICGLAAVKAMESYGNLGIFWNTKWGGIDFIRRFYGIFNGSGYWESRRIKFSQVCFKDTDKHAMHDDAWKVYVRLSGTEIEKKSTQAEFAGMRRECYAYVSFLKMKVRSCCHWCGGSCCFTLEPSPWEYCRSELPSICRCWCSNMID